MPKPIHELPESVQAFVRVVEDLMARRRAAAARGELRRSEWPREWSRQELYDTVYAGYKAVVDGRVRTTPSREKVMELADYLDCTSEERNRLLAAAHARTEPPYLIGADLLPALQVAIEVASYIPLPAYIINRDWQIHYVNDHALTLLGISRNELERIPTELQNIIQIVFNPALPVYDRLRVNEESWTYIARRNVYGFKIENLLCQFDPWFMEVVERFKRDLPHFSAMWDEIQPDTVMVEPNGNRTPFPFYVTEMLVANGERIRFRSLLMSVGNYTYPQIVQYIPVDDTSRHVFTKLGIPTPENGWGTAHHCR